MTASFQVGSIHLKLTSDSESCLAFMSRELAGFLLAHPSSSPRILIEIKKSPGLARRPFFGIQSSVNRQSWMVGERFYLYRDGSYALDRLGKNERRLRFFYEDTETAQEEIYYFILSAVGELLERESWVRLHACGFVYDGRAVVISGDSGVGKSTLILWILRNTPHLIFSDETILTDGHKFWGWPLRISSKTPTEMPSERWRRRRWKDRWQVPIPLERMARTPVEGKLFLLNRRQKKLFTFKWSLKFLTGWGLAQMKEYFLRPGHLGSLAKFSLQRACVLWRLRKTYQVITKWENDSGLNFENILKGLDVKKES